MLPRIMGEIANVSDPIKRRLLGHGAERVEKLNARLAAPESAGARADAGASRVRPSSRFCLPKPAPGE